MFSVQHFRKSPLPTTYCAGSTPEKPLQKPHEDCLECRITGFLSMSAIAGYVAYVRMNTPAHDKNQRLFLACFGLGKCNVCRFRLK